MMLSFPQAIRATQQSTGAFNTTAGAANSAAQQTGARAPNLCRMCKMAQIRSVTDALRRT
jgi:hypothetical protein